MWITHFLRYTVVTRPSLSWWCPRTIMTSSPLRIGNERTPCLMRRSLDNGADIIFRLTLEGAVKWALRHFLLSEVTAGREKNKNNKMDLQKIKKMGRNLAFDRIQRLEQIRMSGDWQNSKIESQKAREHYKDDTQLAISRRLCFDCYTRLFTSPNKKITQFFQMQNNCRQCNNLLTTISFAIPH